MKSNPVEEFTTPNPIMASVDTTANELYELMTVNGIRHIPITRDSKIVGLISDRDIRIVLGLTKESKAVILAEDVMSPDPVSVYASDPLDEVAYTMSQSKIGSVLVYDDSDQFLGIFTSTDALNALVEIVRSKETEQ